MGHRNRLSVKPPCTNEILYRTTDLHISVVRSSSCKAQKNLANIKVSVANQDTPFDPLYFDFTGDDPTRPHVFLLYLGNRIIGLLAVQWKECVRKVPWNSAGQPNIREHKAVGPRWSVRLIWVAELKRRKGYARRLLTIASRYFSMSTFRVSNRNP